MVAGRVRASLASGFSWIEGFRSRRRPPRAGRAPAAASPPAPRDPPQGAKRSTPADAPGWCCETHTHGG